MSQTATRQHPRVDAGFVVKLLAGPRAYVARALDLSMAGLSLHDPCGLATAESLNAVALKLPGVEREVVMPVRIARRQGEEVALAFTHIEWDDMFDLARFLAPKL